MTDKKRNTRTPAERAVEALEVERRRVGKLADKRDKLQRDLQLVVADLAIAERRRDYLAESPDLPVEDEAEPDLEPTREQQIEAAEDRADQVATDAARERA